MPAKEHFPGGRLKQTIHHSEQRCLAGTTAAQQDDCFVLPDTKVDSPQYLAATCLVSYISELDQSRHWFIVLEIAWIFSGEIKFDFIDETPAPVFAAFERTHDRMFGFVKVLRSVFILRRIAAPYVPANHAEPQMNPRVAGFQAFFATIRMGFDILNLIQMCAFVHVRHSRFADVSIIT